MTDPSPMSPPQPTVNTASSTAQPPTTSDPISPVSRSAIFQHKTSGAVPPSTHFIDTETPAINDAPVEIGGEEVTVEELKKRTTGEGLVGVSPGLGEEEDIHEEFLGEGGQGVGKGLREKRAQILASRSKDPSVIVDLPKEPTAEEVEAAKSAEGTVTPGIPRDELEKAVEKR